METIRHEEYMRRRRNADPLEEVTLGDLLDNQLGTTDMVNQPPHYNRHGVEAIDAIQAATGDGYEYHLQGTVLKYIWRYRYKGKPQEDLKKARWYLDRLIEEYDDAETP